jgi:hypothetical protein
MGMAKHHQEEVYARGWEDVGTMICGECVVDEALVSAITAYGGADECEYCGKLPTAPTASAPFELVLELVVDGLRHEYEDPIEQMAWDGGYVGDVQDTYDLLWDLEITESEDVHQALLRAIETAEWCQRDPYAATPTQALVWGWSEFRTFVKHRRRFTFLATDDSTADGAGALPMHALPAAIAESVAKAGLVLELPAGTAWWRIRPHSATEGYSGAATLGTPPDSVARDNRMTPKGIGAFYGASTAVGARAEVAGYAEPTQVGTIGQFTSTVALTVVDLRNLPPVPSLFDPDRRHLRAMTQFLRGFVKDATQVADPSDVQNLEYVPTQVVAETFRYDLPVDGIIWRSSKDPSVTTCVLFVPSTEVADLGDEATDTKLVLNPTTVGRISAPL